MIFVGPHMVRGMTRAHAPFDRPSRSDVDTHHATRYHRSMTPRTPLTMLLAFGMGLWVGCREEPDVYCEDGHCECEGSDCICPASGDCDIECTADCDLQCAASGNCTFACGDACVTACTGSGNCTIDVGAGSLVRCTGSGNCDVVCHGECTVECPGQGDCALTCVDDVEGAYQNCDGHQACGPC